MNSPPLTHITIFYLKKSTVANHIIANVQFDCWKWSIINISFLVMNSY